MKKHSTYARQSVFDSTRNLIRYAKLFLFTLGLLTGAEVAFSQTQFQSVYVEPSEELVSNDIYEVSDGYISCGRAVRVPGTSHTIVIKTDLSGNLVWQRKFELGGGRIKPISGGGYILAGGKSGSIAVYKLDVNGATLWSENYSISSPNLFGCNDILPTIDDGNLAYLIVGSYIHQWTSGTSLGTDVLAMKIDDTGTLLWARGYGRNTFAVGYDLHEVGNSAIEIASADPDYPNYLISARSDRYGGSNNRLYVVKVDGTDGDLLFDKLYIPANLSMVPYYNHGKSIAKDNSGNYAICGSTENVTVIDGSGAAQWSKNYSDLEFQNVDAGPDNTGFIFGTQYSYAEESALLKTSFAGVVSWTKTYGGLGQKVDATSDDGFILAGGIDVPAESQMGYFFVKTNDLGESECYEVSRTITPTNSPIQVIDLDGEQPTITSLITVGGTTYDSEPTCLKTYDRGCEEIDDFTYASGGPVSFSVSEDKHLLSSTYYIDEGIADPTWAAPYTIRWTLIESGPTYTDVTYPVPPDEYLTDTRPYSTFGRFITPGGSPPTLRTDKTLCVDIIQTDGCRTRQCFGRDPAYGYDFRTSEGNNADATATDIDDLADRNSLQVSPNPASGKVVISIPGSKEGLIQILDDKGSIVLEQHASQQSNEINISTLKSGLYIVRVIQSSGVQVKKLQVF